jgi:hypothetical protein
VSAGFISPKYRDVFVVAETATALLDKLASHTPPVGITSWLSPAQV